MLLQMALFILFYGWVIFHWIFVPHFFIHSPVVGHLGCFHILAIVNSAAMNIGEPIFLSGNNWLELTNGSLLQTGCAFEFVTIPTAHCCKDYKQAEIFCLSCVASTLLLICFFNCNALGQDLNSALPQAQHSHWMLRIPILYLARFTYLYCQPGIGSSPSDVLPHFPAAHRNSPDAEVDSFQQTHSWDHLSDQLWALSLGFRLLSGETNLRQYLNVFYCEGILVVTHYENGWSGLGGLWKPCHRGKMCSNYAGKT